jgi:hypothetical protein
MCVAVQRVHLHSNAFENVVAHCKGFGQVQGQPNSIVFNYPQPKWIILVHYAPYFPLKSML